jgi:hypothetical protein
MLRKLSRRLTYANVVATLALFGVLAGGTAYAANTIGSTDIIDGQVKSVDIGNGEVNSADVKDQSLTTFDVSTFLGADVVDRTLTGADIALNSLTSANIGESDDFIDLNIGSIAANNCVSFPVFVPQVFQTSHLLLTPRSDAHPALVYSIRNSSSLGQSDILVCNFANATIDDAHTHFGVLSFNN